MQTKTLLQLGNTCGGWLQQAITFGAHIQLRRFTLEQGAPVGLVGYLLTQQIFDQTGLLTGRHPQNRQRLAGTLIDPTRWDLAGPGDADLEPGGVGQIDHMLGHAELLTPGRFAAGSFGIMTLFRAHDAGIALGQFLEAGVAVALVEAFFCAPSAMGAVNVTQRLEADRFTQPFIHRHLLVTNRQLIGHRLCQTADHLADCTTRL